MELALRGSQSQSLSSHSLSLCLLFRLQQDRKSRPLSSRGAQTAACSRDQPTSSSDLSGSAGIGWSRSEPSANVAIPSVEISTYFYCFELQTREFTSHMIFYNKAGKYFQEPQVEPGAQRPLLPSPYPLPCCVLRISARSPLCIPSSKACTWLAQGTLPGEEMGEAVDTLPEATRKRRLLIHQQLLPGITMPGCTEEYFSKVM